LKFLVDLSAGMRVKRWLEELGHSATFSLELGNDPGDDELLAFAAQEQMIVVTIDRGFGKSVFTKGAIAPAIVVLPDASAEIQRGLLARALEEHAAEMLPGAWVIATPGRIRVTKPRA
jgi:predicted nuclease of predicted toxin-antitoxin system